MGKKCFIDKLTCIYTLAETTNPNNIRYVGKTVASLKKRRSQHIYSIKRESNHRINWISSITKNVGVDNLSIEPLEYCRWDESQDLEIYWISQMISWGFNLVNSSLGGEGNYGLKYTEERREKLKKGLRKTSKPVYQYNLDGNLIKKWDSIAELGDVFNKNYRTGVNRCCLGYRNSYKGYMWKYYKKNKIERYKEQKRNTKITKNNSFIKKRKSIVITNKITGKQQICTSIQEASKITGVASSGICKECKNKHTTKSNFNFKYNEICQKE